MKKHIFRILLFLCFAFALVLRSQNADYKLHRLMKKGKIFVNPTTEKGTDFIDSINFSFEDHLILLKIPVKTTDSSPDSLTLLVDTGSPTYLSPRLMQNLPFVGDFQMTDAKGNKKDVTFFLTNLKIQNTVFQEIAVGELEGSEVSAKEIDGVIGANLMQHCLWQIDYARKKIYFSNQLSLLPTQPQTYPISFIKNIFSVPCVQLTINQFPQRPTFWVSTGNPYAISLNQYFTGLRYSAGFVDEPDTLKVGQDIIFATTTQHLEVGGRSVYAVPTLFSNAPNTRLGNEFLKNYVLTIDWANRKLYLTP